MSEQGRTIKIHLVEGTPTGTSVAELMNWTGKVIVFPRTNLPSIGARKDIRTPGIYCLVGESPTESGKPRVYVGESEDVYSRLVQHDRDEEKDFWTRTIAIISKDQNLTKVHVKYLEHRLHQLISVNGEAEVDNPTIPNMPGLPDSDVDDMDYFLGQVRTILPALGFNFVNPRLVLTNAPQIDPHTSPRFYLANEIDIEAYAREYEGEFVVEKGSTARLQPAESWTSYKGLRERLINTGKLKPHPTKQNILIFDEDLSFDSPSAAASVCMARNTNGRFQWRIEGTDQTYKEWKNQLVDEAARTLETDSPTYSS